MSSPRTLGNMAETHPVKAALARSRAAFLAVGIFSGVINISLLSGSIYMLQVYDRALPSRSVPTLIGLSLLLLAVSLLQGALDAIRGRMLTRIGARFDADLSAEVFAISRKLPLMGAKPDQAGQPLRDLDQIRAFLSSLGPTAFFDLPWMPIFFIGCFIIHPWLGILAFVGGFLIVALALVTERKGKLAAQAQVQTGVRRQSFAEASRRCAEAIAAMGMGSAFERRFQRLNQDYVSEGLKAADSTAGIGSFAKVFRQILQSAVLGLGAYLVMQGMMSAGSMIAASVMTSRALAPLETVVAHWKPFGLARQSYHRLNEMLTRARAVPERMMLPKPKGAISVSDLAVGPPGAQKPIIQGVEFELKAGQGLCVIGPSASGKSTLIRALVGVWRPMRGDVRIDGASLPQWNDDQLGAAIGYLPQDVELFEGTVGDNISRFQDSPDAEAIHNAARAAGCYSMVVGLPEGFDTRIGDGGASLSGGQRQRIGLARALYGDPFLVVLDEPNSNLDQDGDAALTQAIRRVRARGGIVVVVTHRSAAFQAVDIVAVVTDGRIKAIGPRDEVLQQFMRRASTETTSRQQVAS